MTKRCGACGSEVGVELVYDSFSLSGEWRCKSCIDKGFPEGSRIVKFTDRSHPLHPSYFLNVETETDLDLLMDVGQKAVKVGGGRIEACFYTAKGKRVAPSSITLGHPRSMSQFRERVDHLRLWLAASKMFET
ncbi:MAG: hypothetical protein ACTSV3_05725 [Candidatus Thorarchaeota archaeon]|nr:MAG: hypothetical protein DRP09_05950 [Candidatus Thorarchaeota archaeon]